VLPPALGLRSVTSKPVPPCFTASGIPHSGWKAGEDPSLLCIGAALKKFSARTKKVIATPGARTGLYVERVDTRRSVAHMVVSLKLTLCSLILATIPRVGLPGGEACAGGTS
jgi:hypothetical protein